MTHQLSFLLVHISPRHQLVSNQKADGSFGWWNDPACLISSHFLGIFSPYHSHRNLQISKTPLEDRSLRGVALHMALLLRRAGTLEAIKVLEAPMDVSAFLSLGQELANFTQLDSRKFNEDMTRYGSKLADQCPMVKSCKITSTIFHALLGSASVFRDLDPEHLKNPFWSSP